MATTAQLRLRENKLIGQMRAIDAEADPETGTLTDEQQQAFDALSTALEQLKAAITRSEALEQLETRGAARPFTSPHQALTLRIAGRDIAPPAAFDGRMATAQDGTRFPLLESRHKLADFTEQRSELSFGGFLRALYFGPQNDLERRALAEAAIGTGGAMVPTPLSMQVIDLLRSEAVAFKAGVITIPMDSQTLRFARQIADPVGGWRLEAAPIVEGQPAFDDVTLVAKNWALLVKVSRELLEDGQNTDAILQQVFAKTAALALDRAILWGSGVAPEPLGIANTPGVQTIAMGVADGAALTNRVPLLDAQMALQLANIPHVSAMVMSPRSARALGGLVDTLGQPLQLPPSLEGIPILTTTSASIAETQGAATDSSSILLGDFSQVYCGMRTALQVSILQERYADTGQIGFILWLRADVLVQHPAALARIKGIIP